MTEIAYNPLSDHLTLVPITALKQKILEITKKKTCPKVSFAFNYTKTVEQIYTLSILIKGYPNGNAKKLLTFTKKK